MEHWTDEELAALSAASGLETSLRREDATLSPPATIWAVRRDNDVYVRSVNGPSATWYRAANRRGTGWIASGGIERDVSFLDPESDAKDTIDSPTARSTALHPARPNGSPRRWRAGPPSGSRPPSTTELSAPVPTGDQS